ncbi:uncharacterized protein JN550_013696 [Neoarthrinium moseri]|uniref:uncharacterized protein n=1 Tax=Neoarthrinium moseri TaxID=1658444 RepID=UPI001FDE0F32|nr:uncharacterized protein JN550_013696 [Neoarthrinium moseri]KAI1856702.1 hypothetical protein JN550_013696 [Neoarthrinium moseri]
MSRPTLVNDDWSAQRLPLELDDETLTEEAQLTREATDCWLSATLHHIFLSKIVANAITAQRQTNQSMLFETISRNQRALETWQSSLPPHLSGHVRPSSLIPKFQRQAICVRTFYLHAMIMVNRPLLLRPLRPQTSQVEDDALQASRTACLGASEKLARQFIDFHRQGQQATTYWFTQNVTFNAISILYIHCLQTLHSPLPFDDGEVGMLTLAQEAHSSLQAYSQHNAANFKYCALLDELQKEATALVGSRSLTIASTLGMTSSPEASSSRDQLEQGMENPFFTSKVNAAPHLPRAVEFDDILWSWFDEFQLQERNGYLGDIGGDAPQ